MATDLFWTAASFAQIVNDMNDILYPLIGGILIGVSSSTMLGGVGRITGISGIIGGSLGKPKLEHLWRYAFLIGLLMGGVIVRFYHPSLFAYNLNFVKWQIIVAGLLVGFGTRLGSGCTSGHGVCGLARMSKRSLIATTIFISFGILTVTLKRLLT